MGTTKKKQRAIKMEGSQVDMLLELTKNLTFFHDQHGVGFTFVEHETMPIRSKKMKRHLTKMLWDAVKKAPSAGALTQVLDLLEAKAIFGSPEVFLCNRVGRGVQGDANSFYYDLGKGKAIRVTPQGWTACDAPILFERYDHQKEQVMPVQGGDPRAIFKVVNVESEYQLLILVCLIASYIPKISHPVSDSHGAHGSGKTTSCLFIKDLIDPSSLMAQSIPRDLKELIQVLAHHYFAVFDNISSLPDWMSDVFSQACTGGGLSKRRLFTTDEDIVYSFRRPIALNGINLVIRKPDLLDRSILLPFERISEDKRMTDEELWAEFERLKPSILGGIFDTLSKAMAIYPTVHLSRTPRMADFAAWGFAIGEALEKGMGEKFLEAYRKTIDRQNEEVIQTNALAESVLKFMEAKAEWKGTVGNAWDELYKIADEPKRDSTFPKSQRMLRKHLGTIRANLQHFGISYEIFPRTKDGYPITFMKNPEKFGAFGSSLEFSNEIKKLSDERKNEANKKEGFFGSANDSLKLKKNKAKQIKPKRKRLKK